MPGGWKGGAGEGKLLLEGIRGERLGSPGGAPSALVDVDEGALGGLPRHGRSRPDVAG